LVGIFFLTGNKNNIVMPILNSNGVFPGKPLEESDKCKRLYHYTSFETFLKIWLSGYLRFASANNVNDLLERRCMWSFKNPQQYPMAGALNDQYGAYKQISLTMDFDTYIRGCMSNMMWGHYGGKCQGVCIELDFSRLNLEGCIYGPVEYADEVEIKHEVDPMLVNQHDIARYITENKNKFFFTKTKAWKEENEFRIVSNSRKELPIRDAVVSISLTRYGLDNYDMIRQLIGDKIPIMMLDYDQTQYNGKNWAIPVMSDAKMRRDLYRKMEEEQKKDTFFSQAADLYEANKNDWDASLLKTYYKLED
jgi:hypothetical protein